MKKRLKDIDITHISLVNKAANNRTFIYKSVKDEPKYDKIVTIAKQNDEQGIVYGVVYEPDKTDAQGEFASAEEIQKASYRFMESLNNKNVDKEHSFKNEDAFVCESWIVKSNDNLFPDALGAWAVGIKIKSQALKESIKKGEITGLSMAGTAVREEVKEEDKNIADAIKSVFESVLKGFKKEEKIDKEAIEKTIKEQVEPLLKESEELKNRLVKAEENAKSLEKEKEELKNELLKSKQITDPVKIDVTDPQAIAKAATELIKKEAEKGNILSVADAVTQLTKETK